MRAVVCRVESASVEVEGRTVGRIDRGLLAYIGVYRGDGSEQARWMADKLLALRLFPDEAGRMNRSVRDVAGSILLIPNFTLAARTRKGTRPSFTDAADPADAQPLFDHLARRCASTSRARPACSAPTCSSTPASTGRLPSSSIRLQSEHDREFLEHRVETRCPHRRSAPRAPHPHAMLKLPIPIPRPPSPISDLRSSIFNLQSPIKPAVCAADNTSDAGGGSADCHDCTALNTRRRRRMP